MRHYSKCILVLVFVVFTNGFAFADEASCEKRLYGQFLKERKSFWLLVEDTLREKRPELSGVFSSYFEYEKLNTELKGLVFSYLERRGEIDSSKPLLQWVPYWKDCEYPLCSNPAYEQLSKSGRFVELEQRRVAAHKKSESLLTSQHRQIFRDEIMSEPSVANLFKKGLAWNRNAVELGCSEAP